MMARIGNKLIAICSAAIGIIYAAGYAVTESTSANTLQSTAAIAQPSPTAAPSYALPVPSELSKPTDTPTAEQPVPKTPSPEASKSTIKPSPESISTPAPTVKSTPKKADPTPIPTPTQKPVPPAQKQKYHDGTFSGSGTNRFGTVEVAVTIKKGKIANVDITSSRTRYPKRYIEGLPQEVLDAQDYNIDTVSGATRSSEDFINAVHEALMQAEGSN